MFLARSRSLFSLAFLAAALVMGASLYLEYGVGLEPCSLCVMQRLFLGGFCLVSLVGALHGPARIGRWVYGALGLLFVLAGAATAARQVLLQRVPIEELMICQPGLHCLMQQVSPFKALVLMFRATAECAQIHWTLFDLSLPEWSLLAFVGMSILAIYQIVGPATGAERRA
ncbi:disulfide bond formation protein B [Pseudomonas gingeri NCPPB 3146 = LMG 5327]|uniref:Disulfide bond formation protein B n=2 Tax=Pseudomonas gingeri TaxID=117681 RepID=A0A7Y8CDT2_9PSED|nr:MULTISPECIES: disulfide bond formation protein B [Pseudomonas]NVZ28860.1 disulfide bond formation protein B [Pseudomonas gingeri]NVZ63315.1 disulfide bond formation protein B [Pseudomonas gingeri]NVZ73808.1 disulfide bond formation protein B [Pseudomonas gingeri]NWA07337.1 disulfide bond formation protein B [Pseudomonas gingeri]NWC14382.1 disulfide bond formation protein B [Pseudomonas gingeri]